MAGRAATAVKSKAKSKPRATAKTTARAKSTKSTASKSLTASETSTPTATATKPRRRVKQETRTRIYWAVFNQNLKRVAVFEFDQKGEAEKRADKLMKASGDHHFIQKIKATVQA